MFTHLYRQSISCVLATVLLASQLSAEGIVVDTTTAVKYRPMMESTANAIPLINIVTPNSTGLSHNKFSEFNIEQRGVIFNNATSSALTQLGGWVQGNANLGTTPARVILNEVTGTNRSLLSGYGEVAGNRADLIIANPNGITVNGGGFINTSRATLTTGMAQINGDTLEGFHVQRGDILIEGNGVNAENIDRVELYTKALVLNAQLHAKALDVTTGENTIARDGTITSDDVTGSEGFSIDSSALGGIYGSTIRLVGTDKGVGINLPQITYASDSLSLRADGHIILGSAVAENTLSVQSHSDSITLKEQTGADHISLISSHSLINEGDLFGIHVDVNAQDMDNSGTIYSDTMNLTLSDSLSNTGTLSAYSSLSATATDMMNGNGALIESQNAVFDISHSLHNTGTLRASLLSLTTPTLLNEQDIIADIAQIETTSLTNNALIKGADTLSVDTQRLINNGGMIGGNQLSIHAETITNNEVLYSTNAIELSASNTLRNTEGSVIRSAGSINIHDTGTLRNETAIIEADGDISIRATAVENLSSMTPTLSTQHISRYVTRMITRSGGGDNWNWDDLYTEKWLDSIAKTGYIPSYILSGGDMLINAATHNRYSMIAADGDLYLSGSLNNEAALNAHEIIETQLKYVRENQDCGWSGCHWNNNSYWGALNHADTITDHVYSTIQAGGSIYGNLLSINNADVVEGSAPTNTSSQGIPASSHFSDISVGSQYTLPSGNYSQFVTVTNPALPYLIESNPLYADYNTFISSDYIMRRLHLDTAANTKRLGDARYETQLVRDAVFRLTGERYLAGFGSDTAQYQALMDNALAVQGDLKLSLGVTLSASQIAALTQDIVWMEDRVVSGEHVLVPVIYLATLKNTTLSGGGKIIAGGDIQLAVTQGLNNGGEIRAGGTLLSQAYTITNTGGTIKSASDMLLHTSGDITNTSGKISGNNVALVSDNGNVVSQTALKTIDLNRNGTTGTLGTVGESATIQSTGDMFLSVSRDITLTGAETAAGGNAVLTSATGNVTLTALEQNSHYINRASNGISEIESMKQHTSILTSGGDVSINATKDVTLNSSSVAGVNVALNAGENVNVTAANDREFMDVQTHNKSTFSSSSKRDMTLKESVVSSSIEGNNISITSGKDTTLQAANLKAQENIQVDAGGDINVLAKAYRQGELHQESKSSLGGLSKSVSIDQLETLNLQAATLKTEAKNIIMNSGKDINIIASKVDAAADVQLKAFEDLLIAAGEEQSSQQHIREKTSFNIAGLAGIATGMVGIDTGPLYTKEIHNKGNYDTTSASSSIKAGGSITADTGSTTIIGSNLDAQKDVAIKADIGGINVLTSQELSNASSLDKKTEIKLANLKEMMQGVVDQTKASLSTDGSGSKVKVKVASATFDESEVKSSAVHNVSSSITSHEGSVKLDSSDDITITGSNLQAAENIDLKSTTGNITIQEATDSQSVDSKEKHASAEISATVQNEYVEIVSAIQAAVKSAEQLKKVKEDYQTYKRSVKELEASQDTLKQQYRDKVPGIDYSDIEDLGEVISNAKEDQKYYIAAVAAATADLATKTVAIATQVLAAASSSGTWGFSAGMQLDIKGEKTTTSDTNTQALASNLNAKNINIQTATATQTTTTISGSNVVATDTLNITTHDLDVHSSVDTTTSKSDTKDLTASIGATMYGGGASSASVGYGEQHATSESETNHNSNLNANTMNINVANDATLKGATVRADDTLNLTVGNNLNVESVRDSYSSNSNGFNVSAGISTSSNEKTSSSGANASLGTNTGRTLNKQTVLTSLTGDNGNISVGNDTHLKGSLVAAGQTDENGVFQDNQNLNLSTKTLTFENSTNTNYSSSNSMNVGASYSDTLNKEKNEHKDKTTLTTSFSTGMTYERTKTLATLGQGNINITDKENSDDLARLNTDTTQVDKSLIKTSMGTKVDATLDTRLLTEDGRKEIKNETKELVQSPGKAYDTMFVQTADVYIVEQDGTSRKLTESEKSNFIQSSDGKVHIATNGIFNDQMAAAKYAAQHSSSEGAQYVVYFPQADNAVSELLVAGYQKFLEGDTIGLTNATQEIKNLTNKYGQEGLQLDGHSRGSLTIGNALDSIATQPNAQGSLSNTTINFFGPAQNVLNADEQLSYLQNRDAVTNLDTKNNMVIHYMNNAADPVGTYIGGNAPTGGTIPQTEPITTTIVSGIPVSNANTNLNEMVRAGTGQANTSHNSYGNAKQESLDSFWGGKTPNLTPIRTYTK